MAAREGRHGTALTASADLVDRGAVAANPVHILAMHVSTGKATTYDLTLEPWGPYSQPNKASVPALFYRRAQMGDLVCAVLHPGALGIRWFHIQHCPR